LTPRITQQSFGLPHWSLSFPLAALTVLTLRLASTPEGAWLTTPGLILLALVSLIILGLSWSTLRSLRAGALLVPEPAAPAPAP
jgi:tellurite resistance protein